MTTNIVRVTKHCGRYNLCSNEKEWLVILYLPNGQKLSEAWAKDHEPEIDGLLASEIVELISQRVEEYWLSTNREKQREIIAWCRQHANEIDRLFVEYQLEQLKRRRATVDNEIVKLEELLTGL